MLQKITRITLLIAGFLITLAIISNTFDGDFGWHLRFGKDAFDGRFQYTDTYTWPYYSQPWTNHEWGGDLLYWLLYSSLGYYSLVLLTAAAIWAAFLIVQKIFFKKLSSLNIIAAILAICSIKFVLAMRLAYLVPLLFALLWLTLDKIPQKKYYYFWPIILWVWSALHGSWILGFIIINIYLVGQLINKLLEKYWPKNSGKKSEWAKNIFTKVIFLQIISLAAIGLNPYAGKIYTEIAGYFSPAYFKNFVNEWIPSYAYPVYVIPLIMAASSFVFLLMGYRRKKVGAEHLILFVAIFLSAWQYKRNNFYLVFVCLPLLTTVASEIKDIIIEQKKLWLQKYSKYLSFAFCFIAIIVAVLAASKIHYTSDIWQDRYLLDRYPFPYDAANFMNDESRIKTSFLFNEFWWGGYLNWTAPNALVFLDGRGTATWNYNGSPALREYKSIKYETGGLEKIENNQTNYVLLSKRLAGYPKPNWINRLIFSEEDFKKIFINEDSELEKSLIISEKWQLVYEDRISRIWKRKGPPEGGPE